MPTNANNILSMVGIGQKNECELKFCSFLKI
jgi:hypothetical protein